MPRAAYLLTAALRALREQGNGDDPILVFGVVPRDGVEGFAIGPAERDADHAARSGNDAKILAVGRDDLHAGVAGDVQASGGIERAAIATESAAFQLGEFALIGQ